VHTLDLHLLNPLMFSTCLPVLCCPSLQIVWGVGGFAVDSRLVGMLDLFLLKQPMLSTSPPVYSWSSMVESRATHDMDGLICRSYQTVCASCQHV
jgi:hypothetical protein